MSGRRCIYCQPSDEAYRIDVLTGRETPTEVLLCHWAEEAPEAQAKLIDTPPWLQHNALAGHLMRNNDCAICPCFRASPDAPQLVETRLPV